MLKNLFATLVLFTGLTVAYAEHRVATVDYQKAVSSYLGFAELQQELKEYAEQLENDLKAKAKQLKNKNAFVLTTSANVKVSTTFANFFKELFQYFEMSFSGLLHINCSNGYDEIENVLPIKKFLSTMDISHKKA